jgi:hypothetical protein
MAENIQMLRGIPMQYEPKRPNRFIAVFDEELGIEIWSVQKFKRPQLKINPVEIKYMNTSNWVAGNYTWQPIEITFLDLIGPSTSQKLMEWVRLHVESISGKEGYAAGYKKTIVLKQLDPTGVPIDKWTLEDCMITDFSAGENDHESDAVQTLTLTVQPFRCIHNI